MSQAPIMPFYTDAYLADTHHLSTEAHGAYLLLLLFCWRHNGIPAPDDDMQLARITKLSPRRWKQMRQQLAPYFSIDASGWKQKRLMETWVQTQHKISRNRANGMRGNAVRKQRAKIMESPDIANANASATVSASYQPLSHQPSLQKAVRNCEGTAIATPAIDGLRPILSDVQYFVRGGKQISPALAPQLLAARAEAASLLAPMSDAQAGDMVARLWRMYPSRGTDQPALQHDYHDWFLRYPADLAEQAIATVIERHAYASLPRIADFAGLLQPAFEQRRLLVERVGRLCAQLGASGDA